MPWLDNGKCCGSKKGANTINPSTFTKQITLTTKYFNPNETSNEITIGTQTSTVQWASIKSNSSRGFNTSNPFNTSDIQNEMQTNYIFTTFYFADYQIYQYIEYQGRAYKIENRENKNLTNEYIVFIAKETGSVLNANNFL